MITFLVNLLSGQEFQVTDNPGQILLASLTKILQQNNITAKIIYALCEGEKKNLKKTLSENNIVNGSRVIINLDQTTPTPTPVEPQKNIMNENLEYLKKCFDFITKVCKVPVNILDNRGNCLGSWETGRKNGPPGFLKDYIPPLGWVALGLKAWGVYDNGDNTWIGNKNVKGEWYIAYHSIKSIESVSGILLNGFRRGPFQNYKNDENSNPLTRNEYPTCGEGVYFIQNFQIAKFYAETFNYMGNSFQIILMCRINPYKVRIVELGDNLESWIVNGDKLHDPNGKKRDDEVRAYRILMRMN